jgi:hypothetical protein
MSANVTRRDSAAGVDHCGLSAWDAICAVVRDGLVRAGIDPASARALRAAPVLPRATGEADLPGNAAQAGIERSPGGGAKDEVEEFSLEDGDGLAAIFAEKVGHLVRRYQDGQEPDFAKVSLAELLAWCLTRPKDRL